MHIYIYTSPDDWNHEHLKEEKTAAAADGEVVKRRGEKHGGSKQLEQIIAHR